VSFFDDDDDALPPTTIRRPRSPRPPRPPAPPRGERGRRPPSRDQHAIVVRRRIVAAIGLAILIAIILIIAAVVGGGNREGLEKYNAAVGTLARESDEQIATPFFQALSSARGEQGTDVQQRLDGLREEAEHQAERARRLSVPEGMQGAQRYLLQVLDLRAEGVGKVAERIGVALGGQSESETAYKQIAGAMEIFLTADVLYSQRVVPLIQEELSASGLSGQSTYGSHFLPNLGWLEPATVAARTGGHANTAQSSGTGSQGSALSAVSVGSNTLAPPPELNHIHSGANPTFTVKVEDAGSGTESNVSVSVAVTAAGKQYSAFGTIASIAPGQSSTVNIPVEGVPLNTGAKITVDIEPVPGETDVENNKGTYEAIFS
jgi:hypothetical protein